LPTIDWGNGTYTATFISRLAAAPATISASVGGALVTRAPAPTLEIVSSSWNFTVKLRSATGWTDGSSTPISAAFANPGIAGATFECRAAPVDLIGSVGFTPCDGGSGTGLTYSPIATAGREEGSYLFEARYSIGGNPGPTLAQHFYAHTSMDHLTECPAPASPQAFFNKAAEFLPLNETFDDLTVVEKPFVKIHLTTQEF
jgi:hypothetical protein